MVEEEDMDKGIEEAKANILVTEIGIQNQGITTGEETESCNIKKISFPLVNGRKIDSYFPMQPSKL